MISDYGRVLLDPLTEWAVNLNSAGEPVIFPAPVYFLLQHAWYFMVGISISSTRWLSFASAAAASLVLREFVKARAVPPAPATVVSLLFFSDPLFVQSYWGGRPDAFAILCALSGALFWHRALRSQSNAQAIAGGAFAACSIFAWPTAIVTLSVTFTDFVNRVLVRRKFLLKVLAIAVGTSLSIAVLIVLALHPYWDRIPTSITDLGGLGALESPRPTPYGALVILAKSYVRAPMLLVAALVVLVLQAHEKKITSSAIATALALLGIYLFLPPFYSWRLLYVVPLAYLTLADTAANWWSRSAHFRGLLWASLLLSLAVNVVGRTAVALLEAEQRDYGRFESSLIELVPKESIVVGDWSSYYIGLKHNWKMFNRGFDPDRARQLEAFYLVTESDSGLQEWEECFQREYVGATGKPETELSLGSARGYRRNVYKITPRPFRRGKKAACE